MVSRALAMTWLGRLSSTFVVNSVSQSRQFEDAAHWARRRHFHALVADRSFSNQDRWVGEVHLMLCNGVCLLIGIDRQERRSNSVELG